MAFPHNTETAADWARFADQLRACIVPPRGRDVCEECGGSGTIGSEQRYTDPCAGGGEMQWRGYLPTNFCMICNGTGVWPPLERTAQ
jgi:hypothetical protein